MMSNKVVCLIEEWGWFFVVYCRTDEHPANELITPIEKSEMIW